LAAEHEKRSADTFEDKKGTKVEAVEEGRTTTTGYSYELKLRKMFWIVPTKEALMNALLVWKSLLEVK